MTVNISSRKPIQHSSEYYVNRSTNQKVNLTSKDSNKGTFTRSGVAGGSGGTLSWNITTKIPKARPHKGKGSIWT